MIIAHLFEGWKRLWTAQAGPGPAWSAGAELSRDSFVGSTFDIDSRYTQLAVLAVVNAVV